MRFLYRCKNVVCLLLATAFAVLVTFCTRSVAVCKLSALSGERTFYLYSSSSQAMQKHVLELADLPFVCGESVRLDIKTDEMQTERLAMDIAKTYGAKLQFVEYLYGGNCYYFYAEALGKPTLLNGVAVNLHVAITRDTCVVGTPLIFGGF